MPNFLYQVAKTGYLFYFSLYHEFHFNLIAYFKALLWFFRDYLFYLLGKRNPKQSLSLLNTTPVLADKTSHHPIEPIYFLQDAWAAGQIFSYRPKHHYDVSSYAKTMAIISQFVPTTFIDLRPLDIKLPGLT
ncbi:MAG TPA: hypothetical protein VF209_00780, partial [Patescibacteria group bacterium]